jgi:hypothetical protein
LECWGAILYLLLCAETESQLKKVCRAWSGIANSSSLLPQQRTELVPAMITPISKDKHESDPAFFRTLENWMRVDDPDGGEIIVLEFAEGGRVNVLTDKPLLFIEPERH